MSVTPVSGSAISYKRHRFPAEIISHCVWLYHRFGLSLRDVQELMAERGVAVTYETVHHWPFNPIEVRPHFGGDGYQGRSPDRGG